MSRYCNLILAALVAASFTMVAGSAFAQDDKGFVRFKGYVMAGIGQIDVDPGTASSESITEWNPESQGQLEARGGTGPVTARYRLRVREDTRQANEQTIDVSDAQDASVEIDIGDGSEHFAALRHNITWKVTDAFTLRFDGVGFGTNYSLNAYGAYSVGHFGDGFTIGDKAAQGLMVNVRGVDATFKTGGIEVGAMILVDCNPKCPDASQESQTLIPHFYGKFGAIRVAAFIQMAESTAKDGTTSVENTLNDVNVRYKTGAMDIGFEYATSEDKDDAGDKAELNSIALGGKFGPIGAHYVTSEKGAVGATLLETTELTVAYKMKLTDKASLAFGYAIQTEEKSATVEKETTLWAVTAKTNW